MRGGNYEGLNAGERSGCGVNVPLPTGAITTLAFFAIRAVVNGRRR
jgi:hypothetical protein